MTLVSRSCPPHTCLGPASASSLWPRGHCAVGRDVPTSSPYLQDEKKFFRGVQTLITCGQTLIRGGHTPLINIHGNTKQRDRITAKSREGNKTIPGYGTNLPCSLQTISLLLPHDPSSDALYDVSHCSPAKDISRHYTLCKMSHSFRASYYTIATVVPTFQFPFLEGVRILVGTVIAVPG
jgi:hypothetical protein